MTTLRLILLAALVGQSAVGSLSAAVELPSLAATNSGVDKGQCIRSWLLLGPIAITNAADANVPDEATQKAGWAQDEFAEKLAALRVGPTPGEALILGGKEYSWKRIDSPTEVIDLRTELGSNDYAAAYAWTEVTVTHATKAVLGIGSDDAVQVWWNGMLVHQKWVGRAVRKDDDVLAIDLERGVNRILVKVQNQRQGWGFVARLLAPDDVAERFVRAGADGDIDLLTQLLDAGVEVDVANRAGLTALQAARLRGYEETTRFLSGKGADNRRSMPLAGRLIDAMFAEIVKGDSPGAAVLVAQDGQVLFESGYGFASLEHRVRITPRVKFRIGSVSKQFTGAAILLLQQAGKLNVTNTLADFMPDFPRGDEVTLHHLLTHTSGIHSYTDDPDFVESVTVEVKPEDLIKSFRDDPYDFSPGEGWHYSNSGYFLLGQIVEKVSGMSYAAFLKQKIFDVAGMTNSGVHHWSSILDHEVTGYSYGPPEGSKSFSVRSKQGDTNRFSKALNWDMSRAGGAGALYSTVHDLYRWNEALFNWRILWPSTLHAALTPARLKDGSNPPGVTYGYGWMPTEFRGLKIVQHSGGLHGFLSHLARYPEHNLTVVVLANAVPPPPGLDPGALCQEIAQIYLSEKMSPRPERRVNLAVGPASYRSVVGRYDYGNGMVMTVTIENDHLYAQLTGQPQHEIFPRSPHDFFWKAVEAEIKFELDDEGKVVRGVHRQGGQTLNVPRLPDSEVVKLDPKVAEDYIGRYDYGAGKAILTVTRDGQQLYAQLTGQPKFEIFPKSEREFFWKAVEAKVTFVRDSQGKVVKAVHSQGGRTFDAPKL